MTVRSPRDKRRTPWVLIAVGLVLVVAAILLLRSNTAAPSDAGTLPAMAAGNPPAPTTTSPVQQRSLGLPSTISSSLSQPTRSAPDAGHSSSATPASRSASVAPVASTTATTAAAAPSRPAVLHLPTLHVTATIDPVDSTHGVLQVPDDISRIGWWQHSAPAGSTAGSTVLDGHIDSAVTGEGALFHLADLAPGDPVSLTTSAGATISYRVQARRVYVKEKGLPAELFSQQGPGRLVIISCGGTFDPSIRSYEENIAVFAVPVRS